MKLTLFIFLLSLSGLAQEAQKEELNIDEPYKWVVKFGGTTPALQIEAKALEGGAKPLTYSPSTQAKTFVSLNYEKYGLSLSTYNPRTSDFRRIYGDGSAIDFQFRIDWEPVYVETYFQQYSGYYLKNAEEVMSSALGPNGELPQYTSLRAQNIGFQIFKYKNPEKFHPHRAFEFIDRAKESGGSWFYSLAGNYHEARSPDSLVPTTAYGSYGELDNWRSSSAFTLAAGGGGAYSYVANQKWVISGLFGLSLGVQSSSAKYLAASENKEQLTLKTQAKIALGYSGEKFIAGLNIQNDTTQIKLQSTEILLSAIDSSVFIGWRF